MKYQPWKRMLCCLLTAVLILGNIPIFSFAEESDGLCPHHTVHTPECGYTPASPGSPCTHEHTEGCYQTVTECVHAHDDTCGYIPAVEGHGCDCVPDAQGVLTHAEGCGYVEAVEGTPCGHTCSAESGCVTRELVCPHIHDAACGYIAPTPEQPCTYVCQDCADSKAAEGVQALMDALPTPEEVKAMSMEDQAKVYNQVQSAYDAYEALTESQKALVSDVESTFAPLFDYFNSLTAPAATHSHAVCGESSCSHGHSSHTWTAWNGKSDIGNAYYYLTNDVVRTTNYYINGDVRICLNGHTLSTEGNCPVFVVNEGAHLYICDCVGGGKLISDDGDTSSAGSSEIGIENYGGVVLWGGCISGKWAGVECTNGDVIVCGGTVESSQSEGIILSGASTLKMTGGVVSGLPAIRGKDSTSQITISGGRTDSAGNVSIATGGSIVISGGTVGNGVSGHQVSLSGSPSVPYIASNSAVVLRDDNGNSYTGSGFTLKSGVSSGSIAVTQLPDQKYANQITVTDGTNTGLMAGRLTLSGTDALTIDRPIASGSAGTGSSVQWALYDNGDFYLLGSGAVPDYSSASYAPWYSYRSRITSLVVSDGITGIGSNAFRDSGLESVSFGKASLSLGNYSFANCASLKTIDFGSGTITPGECVFEYCTALTTVSVPANVTMVGSYSGIGSGYRMFGGCTGLQTATVDCAYVGPFFFESCTSMTQATFTNASVQFYFLEENSGHPFHANSQAMNVTVVGCLCSRANVLVQRSQGRYNLTLTFSQIAEDTTQHTEQVLSGTATCTEAGLSEGKVCSVCGYVIEKQTNVGALGHDIQQHKGQPATCTEDGWADYETCSRCNYTTYKEIPAAHTLSHVEGKAATCTEAGNIAHYHCSACQKNFEDETGTKVLTTVAIPAGHNFVDGVCTRCDALGGTCGENLTWVLTVDGTLTISGTGAMADYEYCEDVPWFSSTAKIKHVVIESGATSIGSRAFGNCLNLTDVSIPEGVTSIGTYAFYDCSNLTGVTLPDSMTSIGEYAFKSCSKLSHINIPNGVTTIDENAFVWCESLTEVSIPASVTTIGQGAFSGCAKLEGISVDPDNPNYSSDQYGVLFNKDKSTLIHFPRPFSGEYTIPDSVTTIGCSAFCCCSLAGVTIPEGVTSIGESAFSLCPNLTSITIPEGVTQLPMYAFQECTKLTSVTIPDSVTFISYCTFASCTELRSITIPKNVTQVSMYAFASCSKLQTITFAGDAPSIINYAFNGITATAYYPFGNSTWTSDKLKDYGGAITWKAVCSVHSWGEWAVTTPATPEADGVETRKCAVCQQEETRPLVYSGNRLVLTGTELENQSTVWIDGVPVSVQTDDAGNSYVVLPEGASSILVTYSFNTGSGDRHTQYPTGMNVYRVETTDSGLTVTHLPELQNLLQYSGCSIRITGNKGIRMITSINKGTRSALMGDGLAGYTLVEYGTALCRASALAGGAPLVLGGAGVKSNHAYKQGVADPIFKDTGSLIQYTNVLVGFTDEDCKEDIAMRPYIILADEKGETVTIYGGVVYRSIGYIAWQNRNAFTPGSAAYEYVWNIIRYVYGDQYDADYKG